MAVALALVFVSVASAASTVPRNALRGPGAVAPPVQAQRWENPGFGWSNAILCAGVIVVAGLALDYAFTTRVEGRKQWGDLWQGPRHGTPTTVH